MWVRGVQRRPNRGRDFRGGGSDRTRWFFLRPESDFVTGQIGYLGGALPMLEKFKVRRHMLRTIMFLLFDHIVGSNTLLWSLSNGGYIVTVPDRRPETVRRGRTASGRAPADLPDVPESPARKPRLP